MNSKNQRPRLPSVYPEISINFSQASKEQDDFSISQVKMQLKKRPREITNVQDQRSHLPKKTQKYQTTPLSKTIIVTLGENLVKYQLTHSQTGSLYAALNTLTAIREEVERNPGKEMLVCGKKGIKGYINLGMPLSCFPEGSHMVITFSKIKTEEKISKSVFCQQDQALADCVKFYIHAVGERNERILRCEELHKEGNKLCVYGFKGETIKDTLRKDGRFESFVENDHWKLIIKQENTILENSQLVDGLEGKLFQVEAEIEKKLRAMVAAAAQNSEVEQRKFQELKECIVDEYPSLTREREKIRAYITERSKNSNFFKAHSTYFRNLTKHSTSGEIIKLLSQFIGSVGLIYWNNNGNKGCATCFVFRHLYIVTCRHVINDIVGAGTEPGQWAEKISQYGKVTFDDRAFPVESDDNCFSIEPWFEISNVALNYAVLKMKQNGQQVPPGLYNGVSPAPLTGLLYTMGHPDGKKMFTDGCTVFPQSRQQKKEQEHVQAGDCSGPMQYVSMYTQRSFQKITHDPGMVTDENTFFCGSSGSPVFDSKGSLVAMHTVGFVCEYQNGVFNIVEFGTPMEDIHNDIKENHELWYKEVCVNQQDVEMLSQDSCDKTTEEEHENEQDVEMLSQDPCDKTTEEEHKKEL